MPSRHPSAERALVGKLAPRCRAGTVEGCSAERALNVPSRHRAEQALDVPSRH